MADILTTDEERIDAPAMGGGGAPSSPRRDGDKARRGTQYEELITGTAKRVVKGAGQVILGGDRGSTGLPSDAEHGGEIMSRSRDMIVKSRAAAVSGAWDTDNVLGGINPEFWNHPSVTSRYPAMYHQAVESAATRKSFAAQVGKNFTAGNMGTAGTPYGLVPFDLDGVLAP